MRINSCRDENGASVAGSSSSSSRDRQQPAAPSAAEQEAVLAGFHAYANQATTAATPVAAQPPQSVGGPFSATSARPVPQSYLVPPVAGGNGAGSVGSVASYGMRPPVHPGPFSAVGPWTTQPQQLALNTRPEEFAYSASTQATDAVQEPGLDYLSNDDRDGLTANKPINGTSASGVPMGGGNPFAHSAVPQPYARPAAIETPAAIEAPAAKSALAPEVLARIEANKLAAQAKLAAAKQRAAQEANSINGHQPLSTARSLPLPGTHTLAPPPLHTAPAPAAAAFAASAERTGSVACVGSPGANSTSLSTRAASINEPPMAVRPSPMKADAAAQLAASSSTHTFSTGRGGSVHVSEAHMQRAGEHFSVASTASTAAPSGPFAPTHAPPKLAAMQATAAERSGTNFGGSATLFFDGGSLGNPGKGGAGYQLFADNGRTIKESAVRMNGTSTNNQAEYVGLIHGLTAALHSGMQELTVYGDSEVVIKQMLGQYQVKNPVLIALHQRAVVLRQQFKRVALQWIPREKNGGADALSKKAMHQAEAAGEAADWFR
jgi:ribonuclease HI